MQLTNAVLLSFWITMKYMWWQSSGCTDRSVRLAIVLETNWSGDSVIQTSIEKGNGTERMILKLFVYFAEAPNCVGVSFWGSEIIENKCQKWIKSTQTLRFHFHRVRAPGKSSIAVLYNKINANPYVYLWVGTWIWGSDIWVDVMKRFDLKMLLEFARLL